MIEMMENYTVGFAAASRREERLKTSILKKGEIYIESVDGQKYFLPILDKFSRHTTPVPPRTKRDASDKIIDFLTRFE